MTDRARLLNAVLAAVRAAAKFHRHEDMCAYLLVNIRSYGDETRSQLAHAWLSPAPMDLRVNTMKIARDAVIAGGWTRQVSDGYAERPDRNATNMARASTGESTCLRRGSPPPRPS